MFPQLLKNLKRPGGGDLPSSAQLTLNDFQQDCLFFGTVNKCKFYFGFYVLEVNVQLKILINCIYFVL